MWNFLTLSERDLGTLTYLMKDPTGAMRIKCTTFDGIRLIYIISA